MRRFQAFLWLGGLLSLVTLAACGGASEPTEPISTPTGIPTQVPQATTTKGKVTVVGTITAYETGERVGDLYLYAFRAARDLASGQLQVDPESITAPDVPQTAIDAEGSFTLELPAGQYILVVTDQPNAPTSPHFSPVGDANQQVILLNLKA